MARPLRIEFAGALYHITSCVNAREDIFQDSSDRLNFLELLNKIKKRLVSDLLPMVILPLVMNPLKKKY